MTRKRYSIMVIQYGSKDEVELCQVDRAPHELAQAAAEKMLRISAGHRSVYIPKYTSVRVIDHHEECEVDR
jgi:adenosine/AMP kinase